MEHWCGLWGKFLIPQKLRVFILGKCVMFSWLMVLALFTRDKSIHSCMTYIVMSVFELLRHNDNIVGRFIYFSIIYKNYASIMVTISVENVLNCMVSSNGSFFDFLSYNWTVSQINPIFWFIRISHFFILQLIQW